MFLEGDLLSPELRESVQSASETGMSSSPHWPRITLLHNDIRPAHILVEPDIGSLSAIIDFGDARLGPVEMEFYFMWLRWWNRREDVDEVLKGYVAEADPGLQFTDTVRFLRMVAAMGNADGRWCKPEEALAEVEALAGRL